MVSFLVSLVLSSEHYAVYHVSLAVDSFAYSFSYRVNLLYSVSSKIERDFSSIALRNVFSETLVCLRKK